MKTAAPVAMLLAFLSVCCFLLESAAEPTPADDYDVKLAASELTARAFEAVRAQRLLRGIEIDPADDPNGTGLIGPGYSGITTTLGNLDAKRSTTNPNFSALVVELFSELGLVPGDAVAVNLSGSFPAANIAVLCAAEAMGLRPFIISSVGASSYGGNLPGFTYPEMERHIYDAGIISCKSAFVSVGGEGDRGEDMDPASRDEVIERLVSQGYPMFFVEDSAENIALRYSLYTEGGPVGCFVNVGGNMASLGDSDVMISLRGGIVTQLPSSAYDKGLGLIQRFVRDGVPVIHMLNMRDLCVRYGLPVDPQPLPRPGEGGVYYRVSYNRPAALAAAAAGVATLVFALE